nr:MarR family transcriptional regulator [uncultured Alloprevotella sp.]
MVVDPQFPNCPIRNVLARICEPDLLWLVHIVGKKDSATLEELLQEMEDRTPKEVETALCKLMTDGIIKQSAKSFSLTDRGLSLLPLAENLAHWCEQNFCSKQF